MVTMSVARVEAVSLQSSVFFIEHLLYAGAGSEGPSFLSKLAGKASWAYNFTDKS